MSRVTNVILTSHVGPSNPRPEEEIESVNRFLQADAAGGGGKFIEVTDHAGGYKYMECRVFVSAFNHADTNYILKAVHQAPWYQRDAVQVFVKDQEEGQFRLRWYGEDLNSNVPVDLTRQDLRIIYNALNHACFGMELQKGFVGSFGSGVDNVQFERRIGSSFEDVQSLIARLGTVVQER
jgi:hypothetical protein